MFIVDVDGANNGQTNGVVDPKRYRIKRKGIYKAIKPLRWICMPERIWRRRCGLRPTGPLKFYNGNMTLKVGDVNPLSWELLHSINVPIIGLTIDGEMVYIKPSAELFHIWPITLKRLAQLNMKTSKTFRLFQLK